MWSSFFSGAFGVGSLIMGIVFSTLKPREKYNGIIRYSMLALAFIIGVFTLLYGLFVGGQISMNALLIITTVPFLFVGVILVLVNVPSTTAMMRIADKDKFGKVSSVMNIGSQGLIPIATLLGGVAISTLGPLGLMIVCAAGLLVPSLALFFLRPVREL